MRSTGARVGVLALLAAAAVALFIVLSSGDDGDEAASTPSASTQPAGNPQPPAVETIRLAGGAPVGGVETLEFSQGEQIKFRVVPEPDLTEIHVHGYEITRVTSDTKPLTISLPAEISGGFEVEAHSRDGEFEIARIKVEP